MIIQSLHVCLSIETHFQMHLEYRFYKKRFKVEAQDSASNATMYGYIQRDYKDVEVTLVQNGKVIPNNRDNITLLKDDRPIFIVRGMRRRMCG